jgi:endonuclease YncB( thermonuclease family)
MLSARLATIATIAGLTAALLAGCSSTTSSHVTPTKAAAGASAVVTTEPHQLQAQVVKIIDPTTIVLAPYADGAAAHGQDFTLDINTFTAPVASACGYDQALSTAKTLVAPKSVWFVDYGTTSNSIYVDKNGVHHGNLKSNALDYGEQMLKDGMGSTDGKAGLQFLVDAQTAAKTAKTGLWGTCPDFGA